MLTSRGLTGALAIAILLLGGRMMTDAPPVPGPSGPPSDAARTPQATTANLPSTCPVGTPTLGEVAALPAEDRAECFGTSDLTLRGWVFQELNPAYDCTTVLPQPMWLSCILSRQRILLDEHAPAEWSPELTGLWVASDPDGPVGAIWFGASDGVLPVNTWVKVTGHFADPAAESCGPPGDPLRIECEGTLVLAKVEPVEVLGPTEAEALAELSIVRAANPGVSLREEPTTTGERLGSLAEGSRSVILEGPVSADGYEWYLLSGPGLPPASGCITPLPNEPFSCPIWLGWGAAGPDNSWFTEDPIACPDPATDVRALAMLGDYEALHCYSGQELELVGWLPSYASTPEPDPCPSSGEPGAPDWLWCHDRWWEALYAEPEEVAFIDLFVDPDSEVAIPHDGRWVAVTGHIDDPRASACPESIAAGHPILPQDAVRECRARFVVTAITDVAAP